MLWIVGVGTDESGNADVHGGTPGFDVSGDAKQIFNIGFIAEAAIANGQVVAVPL